VTCVCAFSVDHEVKLTECETNYNKVKASHEEVLSEMKKCKDEFAKVERRDVKYREDLKNEKAKEKKAQANSKKVQRFCFIQSFHSLVHPIPVSFCKT
jgi:hypothetical protein